MYMKKIFTLIALATLLSACSKDDNEDPKPSTDPMTVLVYMAGDNNLSSFTINDLNEMKEGSMKLTDVDNLLVYVDGRNQNPYYAHIKNGTVVDSVSLESTFSADPKVLEEMLKRARTNYPAKSYGLVLWGHANGWVISQDSIPYAQSRAYGVDNSTKTYWMNIPSMARAIEKGMGGEKLKYIFADCCNLCCIEAAYELRNATNYLIGSPAEIPDPGAPYELIVSDLFDRSETSYKAIIDTYYDTYYDIYQVGKKGNVSFYNLKPGDLKGYSVPLAAVRTADLQNLAQATAKILGTMKEELTPEGDLILDDVVFHAYSRNKYAYDMMHGLKRNATQSDFSTWETAFKQAVPYSRYSGHWLTSSTSLAKEMDNQNFDVHASDCGVVSMFFPRQVYNDLVPSWNTTIQQFQWNNVIQWQQYDW